MTPRPTAAADGGALDLVGGLYVVLASVQFGGVVILGKLVTDAGLPVPAFLALRFALCAAALAAVLAVLGQPLRAARGEGGRLAVLGAAGYAVEAGLFFLALGHGTAAAVTLLFFTYPIWVVLASVARGRGAPGRLVAMALVGSVAGAALVVASSGGLELSPAAVVFAFAAAVTFAAYLSGAETVLRRTNSLTGAMWVSAAAAAALALFAVATGTGAWPRGLHQWAPVVGTAAFTAGAFVTLFAGLRRLGAVRTSIVAATEPLAATLMAVAFLHDPLRPGTVAGGLLILTGAVAASLARRERRAEPPLP